MRTILVTGGAGFIGSHFVEYWFRKYPDDRIVVIDALTYAGNPDNLSDEVKQSPRFEFWYGNVTNDELVGNLVSGSNVVVHFAAESHVARSIFDNKVFYQTDVLGTQTVANSVLHHCAKVERFIHISTSEVYGTALEDPMTEEHPLMPLTPYASAKAGADRLVYSYWATYDIPAVIVRPFNQYGPRQHLEKVVPRFITNALKNEPLQVHGDGTAERDWLYVEDTCLRLDAIIHAPLEKVKGEVFNIGSGECCDIKTIAEMVLDELGKGRDLIVHNEDRMGQVQKHISSTGKGEEMLGIRPGRTFEKGLKATIEWYANNEEWWRRLEWMRSVTVKTKEGRTVTY